MNGIVRSLLLTAAIGLLAVVIVCVSDGSEAVDYYDHKVNFDPEQVLVYYDTEVVEPLATIEVVHTLYAFEKPGYHNITINGGEYDPINGFIITPAARDSGVVIQAEKKQYSIDFNSTEEVAGLVPSSITGKQIGSKITIPSPNFYKLGYSAIGWNKSEDSADVLITEGEHDFDSELISSMFGNNNSVTLYPVWSLNIYSISLSTDRGKAIDWTVNNGKYVSNYSIESGVIVLPVPESDDRFHLFVNWEDSEGNPVSQIASGTVGDIELRAAWMEKTYQIIAKINGRQVTFDLTISSEMPTAEPEDGFEFKGWYCRDEEDNEVRFESMSQMTENMEIYAVFEPTQDDPTVIVICVLAIIAFFAVVIGYGFTRK